MSDASLSFSIKLTVPPGSSENLFDDRSVVSPPRPPTPMTHYPIAQIALNGNPKSPETGASLPFSCRIDYLTHGVLPAASTVPRFFTDDEISSGGVVRGLGEGV